MKILGGNANKKLVKDICESVGIEPVSVEVTKFPDSEISVKIDENIRGENVFIVQPTCPPVNDNLMELLLLADAARRASSPSITAVVPYYGYARQDRKDQGRVPISAKAVANLMVAAGINKMILLDLHSQQIQGFFDIPVDHLYASPVFMKYWETIGLKDVVFVSPDAGGGKKAEAYSALVKGGSFAIISKKRTDGSTVEAQKLVGDVDGRPCILVDDMTSTAGTLCAGAEILEENGAGAIYACVTHSLLSQAGLDKIKGSPIRELVVTDSIPSYIDDANVVTRLSVAELLGSAIVRVHSNRSVSSLFRFGDK